MILKNGTGDGSSPHLSHLSHASKGDTMKIERLPDKCILYPDLEVISRVELLYDSNRCTILFRDGTISSFIHNWEAYHVAYYGLSFSNDGRTVFTGNWDKGIYALDTASGEIIWHYKCTKVRELFAFSNYLVAMRFGDSLCKIDSTTGILLGRLSGSAFESCWQLDDKYILIESKYGKLCIVDTDLMQIVHKYGAPVFNPNGCIGLVIQNAWLKNGSVMISGIEEYDNVGNNYREKQLFERSLGGF